MDPLAADAFALNHPKTPVYCGPVISTAWIPQQAMEGLCGSPPCPAFSRMTGSPGLTASTADSWKDLLRTARLTQTPLILLENVTSLQLRLGQIRELMALAGYVLRWTRTIDLADWSPMRRDRIFLLFARRDVSIQAETEMWLPKGQRCSLSDFQCIWPAGSEPTCQMRTKRSCPTLRTPGSLTSLSPPGWYLRTERSRRYRDATTSAATSRRHTWKNTSFTVRFWDCRKVLDACRPGKSRGRC